MDDEYTPDFQAQLDRDHAALGGHHEVPTIHLHPDGSLTYPEGVTPAQALEDVLRPDGPQLYYVDTEMNRWEKQ